MTKSYSSFDVYYVEFKSTGQFCQIGSLILRIYELYVWLGQFRRFVMKFLGLHIGIQVRLWKAFDPIINNIHVYVLFEKNGRHQKSP